MITQNFCFTNMFFYDGEYTIMFQNDGKCTFHKKYPLKYFFNLQN